jgi:ABC-type transport system involved in multi-copper enzyme maturation permease subunit
VYRLYNLTGFDNIAALSGTIGMMGESSFQPALLMAVQIGWIVLPLSIAGLLFSRKEF